jgi:hypothetical protein
MYYYDTRTERITHKRENPLIHPDGRRTNNPTEDQYEQYYSKGFDLPITPEDYVIIPDSMQIHYDPATNTASVTYEYELLEVAEARWQAETEARRLARKQAEQDRIQAIADNPQAQVALTQLSALLASVGLAIPVSESNATLHVASLMASGAIPGDSGLAGNIKLAWELVLGYMSRQDVAEVWFTLHPELRPEPEWNYKGDEEDV